MKKALALVLTLLMLSVPLVGCSGGSSLQKDIVGDWYRDGGDTLSFYKNGTFRWGSYGGKYFIGSNDSLTLVYNPVHDESDDVFQWSDTGEGLMTWSLSGKTLFFYSDTYTKG